MLNGIGGATVAEAKERIGMDEFDTWLAYRAKHGTFNLGTRIEHGAALQAYFANACHGSIEDYMPQRGAGKSEAVELERAMKEWQ